MNRLIFLLCVSLSCIFSSLQGQSINDTIHYSKGRGDLKFYRNDKEIKFLELSKILKENTEAYEFAKKAKFSRSMNGIFLGIGIISLSYGILFGLGQAIENEDEDYAYAGFIAGTVVGGVFIAMAIPSGHSYKTKAKKAIDIYNFDILETKSSSLNIKTGLSNNGITIILTF